MSNFEDPFANELFQYDSDAENRMDLNRASPFTITESTYRDGDLFYKKTRINPEYVNIPETVHIWNTIYKEIPEIKDAQYDNYYDYFPNIGTQVNKNHEKACKKAQEFLESKGYYHTDLYHKNHDGSIYYNSTNVRQIGTKYYPIDMDKIITLTLKGGLRKRKRKYNIKSYKKQKKQRKKKSKTKKSNL